MSSNIKYVVSANTRALPSLKIIFYKFENIKIVHTV